MSGPGLSTPTNGVQGEPEPVDVAGPTHASSTTPQAKHEDPPKEHGETETQAAVTRTYRHGAEDKLRPMTTREKRMSALQSFERLVKSAGTEERMREIVQAKIDVSTEPQTRGKRRSNIVSHRSSLDLFHVAFNPLVPSSLRARVLADLPLGHLQIKPADRSNENTFEFRLGFEESQPSARRLYSREVQSSTPPAGYAHGGENSSSVPSAQSPEPASASPAHNHPTAPEPSTSVPPRTPRVPLHKYWYQEELDQKMKQNVQTARPPPTPLRVPPLSCPALSPVPLASPHHTARRAAATQVSLASTRASHVQPGFSLTAPSISKRDNEPSMHTPSLCATLNVSLLTYCRSMPPTTARSRGGSRRSQSPRNLLRMTPAESNAISSRSSPSTRDLHSRPSQQPSGKLYPSSDASEPRSSCRPPTTAYISHRTGHICYPSVNPAWKREQQQKVADQLLMAQLVKSDDRLGASSTTPPQHSSNLTGASRPATSHNQHLEWIASNLSFAQMAREAHPSVTNEELIAAYARLREERQMVRRKEEAAKVHASISKLSQLIAKSHRSLNSSPARPQAEEATREPTNTPARSPSTQCNSAQTSVGGLAASYP